MANPFEDPILQKFLGATARDILLVVGSDTDPLPSVAIGLKITVVGDIKIITEKESRKASPTAITIPVLVGDFLVGVYQVYATGTTATCYAYYID